MEKRKVVYISEEAHGKLQEIKHRMEDPFRHSGEVRLGAIVEHLIKTYGDKDKKLNVRR